MRNHGGNSEKEKKIRGINKIKFNKKQHIVKEAVVVVVVVLSSEVVKKNRLASLCIRPLTLVNLLLLSFPLVFRIRESSLKD